LPEELYKVNISGLLKYLIASNLSTELPEVAKLTGLLQAVRHANGSSSLLAEAVRRLVKHSLSINADN
jgi:hypothetical protein